MTALTFESMGQLLDQKFEANLAPINEKITKIDTRLDKHDSRLTVLEDAMKKSGEASRSASFVPTYFDIRGFCTWENRRSQGISRPQALDLVKNLKAQIPEDLQGKIGDIEVRGSCVHKFIVHVTPPFATEIAVLVKELLVQGGTGAQFNGNDVFTTVQKAPEEQRRFEAGGRARAFLETKSKEKDPGATVRRSGLPRLSPHSEELVRGDRDGRSERGGPDGVGQHGG